MAALGTADAVRADEIAADIARKDAVDSLPPEHGQLRVPRYKKLGTGTFQNGGVAGFDRQRRNIGDNLWTRFEDDEKNSNGAGDPLPDQIMV